MRRLTAAVSALACMGVVAAGTAAQVGAQVEPQVQVQHLNSPTVTKKPQAKYQQQAHDTTNEHRVANGLQELKRQDCVQRFAVRQAKKMAQQESMFHQNLGPIVEECNLSAAGENVANGYPNGRSVVNNGWMKSEGHRANILNPDFTLMGIGARKGHDGDWYVAQVFGRKG